MLTTPTAEAASLPVEAISSLSETPTQALQKFTVQTALADKIDPTVPVYVIEHESNWDVDAVGDNGEAFSCAQFHKPTFDEMKKQAGLPLLQYKSCTDQIILLNWALAHHEGNQWTTYRRLNGLP